jgi:hypothetical protein
VRTDLEARFGMDFSSVRIHTDARAAQLDETLHAHAFSVGEHIAFNDGRFQPESGPGRFLLAHELAHVALQRGETGSVENRPVRRGFWGDLYNSAAETLGDIADWAADKVRVLGITADNIFRRLATRVSQTVVDRLRQMLNLATGVWNFVAVLVNEGAAGLWWEVQERISSLETAAATAESTHDSAAAERLRRVKGVVEEEHFIPQSISLSAQVLKADGSVAANINPAPVNNQPERGLAGYRVRA